ncbi:hypothetical protein L9F63_004767 [Diploptera punctata]|uniref:N-acetylneuraminate-9-phosphate synthase n=1 Tax=Diploptera punctata TaxID=6984 RepID=A0AAD8E7K2_DIPPU|nr:hypothetical protein L9F63_004767 [Diploptera punctata]
MPKIIELAPGRWIGESQPCFIIAEVGQNHQGDLEIAKRLIKAAKVRGWTYLMTNCVKFQKSCLHEKFNNAALQRPYIGPNSWGGTYGEHKKYLEFSELQFKELQDYASQINILFSASAMDIVSVDVLDSLGVPFIKIGSGDVNNFPMLQYAATKSKPLIVSTGMQDMSTVETVYHTLKACNANFCLLHCVSAYPTPPQEVNLNVISKYKQEFSDIPIGYSGHELGITISVAAVAMGVLERHITLDKTWKGSDHVCSLTPSEFQELVHQVRTVETALGNPIKCFQPSEKACYDKLGKTLVAARDMLAGKCLQEKDIKVKVAEPKGCPAEKYQQVIGRTLVRNVRQDESIMCSDFV